MSDDIQQCADSSNAVSITAAGSSEGSLTVSSLSVIGKYASGPIVTIIVGEPQSRFFLPKPLLQNKAGDFFSKMLKGPFIEAETNQISLPELDRRSFELFIDWLYRGKIPPIPTNDKAWDKTLGVALMEAVGLLETELVYFYLYSLADRFCLPRLKNDAVTAIMTFHKATETGFHPKLIEYAYSNTPDTSKLRLYLVQATASNVSGSKSGQSESQLAALRAYSQSSQEVVEFLNDLIETMADRMEKSAIPHPHTKSFCDYHDEILHDSCCSAPRQGENNSNFGILAKAVPIPSKNARYKGFY